jgi:DNA (cytosine-5)-methyltransferase 1
VAGADAVKLLDLFCGAGGAAMGYHRAGFEVIGVDINPQPHYPFEFIQANWDEPLFFLPGLWEREGIPYVIHASPPCQRYSTMTKKWGRSDDHPDLVDPVREHLRSIEAPYIIENVVGAPLVDPIRLCGSSFGLPVRRHRLFEFGGGVEAPMLVPPCQHDGPALQVNGHPGGSSTRDPRARFGSTEEWRAGMGIDWMSAPELAEAIPPAYTEWIGHQLMRALKAAA